MRNVWFRPLSRFARSRGWEPAQVGLGDRPSLPDRGSPTAPSSSTVGHVRVALAAILAALALALVLAAFGALQNVWAAEPDGPRWAYAVAAAVFLALAALPATIA